MKFTSTRYPQLVVHDLDVTFVDGEAEVTAKPTIDALKALPSDMGVRAAGGRPAKDANAE
ncbi:hypothetical protein JOF56_000870 [Kibdelosporangium banguiense]|uniref:Uncharacterized protein n=1 Tax=Kibdelosporangium banguiense TaxID=1365924 RepID=A0ABS4T7T8_9PSEU|nr:hypothetical protein [Kibdelosporangium banguiense]MBP2320485.1 hypothetical protein [Kibdelosporangium banguiense]